MVNSSPRSFVRGSRPGSSVIQDVTTSTLVITRVETLSLFYYDVNLVFSFYFFYFRNSFLKLPSLIKVLGKGETDVTVVEEPLPCNSTMPTLTSHFSGTSGMVDDGRRTEGTDPGTDRTGP